MSEQGGGNAAGCKYERFNALYEHGWNRVLSGLEFKVWGAYWKHSDADGTNTFPGLDLLAQYFGHANVARIRQARKELVRYGLLAREDDGTGGRSAAKFRVLMPPPDAVVTWGALQNGGGSNLRRGTEKEGGTERSTHPSPNARALPGAKARAPLLDQTLYQSPDQSNGSVCSANGASPRPQAADVVAKTTRLRNPATKGELGKAREFVAWFAGEIGAAFPDEVFDAALVDLARVVTKLRHQSINGSVELLKTAARLYLAEQRPDGHPIDRWRPRLYTPEQEEKWKAFVDWYVATWPRFHESQPYEFVAARDVDAARNFLKKQQINWDLDWGKNVALHFLGVPEFHNTREHLLPVLAHFGNYYARELKKRQAEGSSHVLGIARSGTAGPVDPIAIPAGRNLGAARQGAGGGGDRPGVSAAG